MKTAILRRLPPPPHQTEEEYCLRTFSESWPYVSLLHDIGYLLEGGLGALRIDLNSDIIRRGAEVIQEYFRHRFWTATAFSAATDRALVRKWAKLTEPDFSPYTVTAVGDSLRALGNLKTLWDCVVKSLEKRVVS